MVNVASPSVQPSPHASVADEVPGKIEKLNALTSLRFAAAAMIVVFHSRGNLGTPAGFLAKWTLTQGVSFFFVLSGFILTHVHPSLDRAGKRRFLVARIARIWPVHLVTFVAFVAVIDRSAISDFPHYVALLNLFLFHAWIPNGIYILSFNEVSWSLSVELFFYVCFLLLLGGGRRAWVVKLGLALCAVGIVSIILNTWHRYFPILWLQVPASPYVVPYMYVNPLARLFEFTLGMVTAYIWRAVRPRINISRNVATICEIVAIFLVIFVISQAGAARLFVSSHFSWIGPERMEWFQNAGIACVPIAILIFFMALGRGWLSWFLTLRPAVFLGEISYSVYMIHWIVVYYGVTHTHAFERFPRLVVYFGFWFAIIFLSYCSWRFVETPSRRMILKQYDRLKLALHTRRVSRRNSI